MLLTSVLAVNITMAVMFAGVSLWRSDILLAWTSCRALAVCLVVGLSIVTQLTISLPPVLPRSVLAGSVGACVDQ